MKVSYLHPFTDYGFHRLFLHENSQSVFLDFLNSLPIFSSLALKTIYKIPKEELSLNTAVSSAITHFHAVNQANEPVLIAIQKAQLNFFKNLNGFFNDFPIWSNPNSMLQFFEKKVSHIYCIGVLDFMFSENRLNSEYIYSQNGIPDIEGVSSLAEKIPYTFCYLELPKFQLSADVLNSKLDIWLYLLSHLESMKEIPLPMQTPVFQRVFEIMDLGALTKDEIWAYEMSLKVFRDWNNIYQSAYEDALKHARASHGK